MEQKDKLILIDGNSLMNRAFYAMTVFTTKEGLPTNGIFGFVKLLFRILDDMHPRYFAIVFDVHEPTFRHKMYTEYKATRKPMPQELVLQFPILKELLSAMNICTLEKAGYEADDIIGTLSTKFPDVDTFIYTGDRDSYQLVKEGVTVCFTRKGVTELDYISAENFTEKTGLKPSQIIDEKALMGDASDNIPGVKGVGPKTANELLRRYGTLDALYSHLEEVSPRIREKLLEDRDSAYLSRTLATIDTNVPIDVSLSDCELTTPFPEEARKLLVKLEFRSLLENDYFAKTKTGGVEVVHCEAISEVLPLLSGVKEVACCLEGDAFHLAFGGKEYIFDLRQDLLSAGVFFDELRPIFDALFSGERTIVLPELKAMQHRLDEIGVEIKGQVEDVSLLRYLADSNLRALNPTTLAAEYDLPPENLASALLLAYEGARRSTDGTPEEKLYRELELPLEDVLLDMERTGVRVETERFPEFSQRFNNELAVLSQRIFDLAGVDSFNLNSPFQLSDVLFEKLGFSTKGLKRNLRGGYSTSADVLEKLAEEHEIARLILRYREIQKLLSTYIDGIRPLVVGGVVHTTYNQTMTTTGRLSSANPNLQNIPVRTELGRELRKLFIAREGNVLVDADYSQIELRLLAHFSGCKALLQAYNNGEDVHAATAARVFGVKLSEVTPAQRRRAKTINFGIIYGMSGFGLAKDLGCSPTEAQSYISAYFAAHPEVKEYMDENVRFAKENGYVMTILGRKRYIHELRSSSYNNRMFGERAAMNMPLQGSAADIIKLAMLRVAKRLKEDNFAAKLVLQVHDELVLDAPEWEKERAGKALKEEMEKAIALKVPLIAEVSFGRSWYDAK